MLQRNEPKWVQILHEKLTNTNADAENKIKIVFEVLQMLSTKLVTFGPLLKIIHGQCVKTFHELQKNVMIETKRREL